MKTRTLLWMLAVFAWPAMAQPPGGGAEGQDEPGMQQMETRMRAMRELMERIHETEDPAERERLMREHMQSMHQGMTMMGGMMRGPMGRGGPGDGQVQPCADGDAACRSRQMEMQQRAMSQRMNMMHRMMEQMMQHMQAQETESRRDRRRRDDN